MRCIRESAKTAIATLGVAGSGAVAVAGAPTVILGFGGLMLFLAAVGNFALQAETDPLS